MMDGLTNLALLRSLREYLGSVSLKTMEDAAMAAAVSAAISVPGSTWLILYKVRGVCMFSGRIQHSWSFTGSPT